MPGIIFATVLIRIVRAISDASTSITDTPAHESVRYQPIPQAAHKSSATLVTKIAASPTSPSSQAPQPAIEACEGRHDDEGCLLNSYRTIHLQRAASPNESHFRVSNNRLHFFTDETGIDTDLCVVGTDLLPALR